MKRTGVDNWGVRLDAPTGGAALQAQRTGQTRGTFGGSASLPFAACAACSSGRCERRYGLQPCVSNDGRPGLQLLALLRYRWQPVLLLWRQHAFLSSGIAAVADVMDR